MPMHGHYGQGATLPVSTDVFRLTYHMNFQIWQVLRARQVATQAYLARHDSVGCRLEEVSCTRATDTQRPHVKLRDISLKPKRVAEEGG